MAVKCLKLKARFWSWYVRDMAARNTMKTNNRAVGYDAEVSVWHFQTFCPVWKLGLHCRRHNSSWPQLLFSVKGKTIKFLLPPSKLQETSVWSSKGRRTRAMWNANNDINISMLLISHQLLTESFTACMLKIFHNFPLWDRAKGLWLLNAAEHLQ